MYGGESEGSCWEGTEKHIQIYRYGYTYIDIRIDKDSDKDN